MAAPAESLDIRAAGDRPVAHRGEKDVSYHLPDGAGVDAASVKYQVADVARAIMGVAEANDQGQSVLFSPAGSFAVPATLVLPEGAPNVPLHRHDDLFWMRAGAGAGDTAPRPAAAVQLNPVSAEAPAQAASTVAPRGLRRPRRSRS